VEARLKKQLEALGRVLRRALLLRALTKCWAAAAAVGLGIVALQSLAGRRFHGNIWLLPVAVGAILASIVLLRRKQRVGNVQALVRALEPRQPEVQHLLLTAAEQRPAQGFAAFSFLQLRVIEAVLEHPRRMAWERELRRRLALARIGHAGALLTLAVTVFALNRGVPSGGSVLGLISGDEIVVSPGDTRVERGTGLVIAARFGGAPPAEATMVLNSASGKESRIPMARRLADPVFGASVPEVSEAGVYHIEYRGKRTRDFKILVFEFPALVRADATLRYPAYTGLTNCAIRDTLRVSAVEGSRLSYTLQLNKPVTRARLVGKEHSLALTPQNEPVALLPDFVLTNTARYTLELFDAEGLSNKFPTLFIFQVLTNQPPEVKLVFPRGDQRVSRLEELHLQAEASDDFGLLKYGIGFGVAGQEPRFIELGQAAPAHIKRQFEYLIALEQLDIAVDQAMTYFAWAEDYGSDGQARRTFSDIFFAEVRPFDEVFRPDSSGSEEGESQAGNPGSSGNERVKLAELQKQIVVATWNLQRRKIGAATSKP